MFNDIVRNQYFDDVSELGLGDDWYVCIDWASGMSQIICGKCMSIPEQSF
jgi:hypothetical protein